MNRNEQPLLVTIAIPTYNRADSYLRNALESALNQTYSKIEVIVSDNCSSDGTEELIKSYSDDRLKYIRHTRNIGAINNFNFGVKEAKGQYFLMLHDDDMIDSDFVQTCLSRANYSTGYGMIRTGIRIIDSEQKTINETRNLAEGLNATQFFRAWFAGKTAVYIPNTLFNLKCLREVGAFGSKRNLTIDGVPIVKLVTKFKRLDIEDIKASFRNHPDELTYAARVKDWSEDFLALLDLMCSLSGQDSDQIRSEGLCFFCQLNYNRTRAIDSPFERFKTYLMVYRMFSYTLSPPWRNMFASLIMRRSTT